MRTASAFAVALVLVLACWSVAHHTVAHDKWIVDTPVYEPYGDAVVHGDVPYRDFTLEYPPASLPVFILPAIGHVGDYPAYSRWFDREMAVCACLALLGVVLMTRAPRALALVAVAPLLLGPVVLSRFDYWPAALTALALAALLRTWLVPAAILFGAAIGAKLWPAVIVPFAVAWLWRTRSRSLALSFAAAVAAVVAAIFIPFVILSPGGVWHSVRVQFARPLQLESLGSALLIAEHHLVGGGLGVGNGFGSQNPLSAASGPMAAAMTVLLVAAVAAVFVGFVRGEPTRERLLVSAAAATTALIAFGKVFSPQFLVWLVPLVALVPGLAAPALLGGALVLTQLYFPADYWSLADGLYVRESLEVLVRDLVVVALFVVLATRVLRRARAAPREPAGATAPAPLA
jgi:hypothetical protein